MKASTSGIRTRQIIVDTALRVFARDGVDGTSLRAIAREAAINDASIHYHFGSRESVIEAAYRRAMEPIRVDRQALLDELLRLAEGRTCTLGEILHVMYWPAFRRFGGISGVGELALEGISVIAQLRVSPRAEARALIDAQSDTFRSMIDVELRRAVPSCSHEQLWLRMSFINSVAWDALAQPFATELTEAQLREMYHEFLDFSEFGLRGGTRGTP